MKQLCFHWTKMCVAARAIHDGVKLRVERNRVTAGGDAKIRCVGGSIDHDIAERSRIPAGRGEYSSNALERAQIGVAEGIIALHRRDPRIVCLPRAEKTSRVN